jgi:hypothetical protein
LQLFLVRSKIVCNLPLKISIYKNPSTACSIERDASKSRRLLCTWPFYSSIVGEESLFIFTIEELHTLAMKMFFNSLSLHASKVLDKVPLYMT